ncbi:MAG: VOC family protein [Saprospiraceae bacterium]|nr:VOC family protein [Saprospiraceae bacterium]
MPPKIEFLDHVALRVKDLEASAEWYQRVLGLQKYQRADWGPFPVLMLAGLSGLALFPFKAHHHNTSPARFVDHFAFRISKEQIPVTLEHLESLEIDFEIQDHPPFQSIYFYDLDGYRIELMAQVTSDDFFGEPN